MRHLWNQGGGPLYQLKEISEVNGQSGEPYVFAHFKPGTFKNEVDMAGVVTQLNHLLARKGKTYFFMVGKAGQGQGEECWIKLRTQRAKVDYPELSEIFHNLKLVNKPHKWRELSKDASAAAPADRRSYTMVFNSNNSDPLKGLELDAPRETETVRRGILHMRMPATRKDVEAWITQLNTAFVESGMLFKAGKLNANECTVLCEINAGSVYNDRSEFYKTLQEAGFVTDHTALHEIMHPSLPASGASLNRSR
jgi:hypothetical protein